MWFKRYEHFHLNTSTGQTDHWHHFAYQWLVNIKINQYVKFDPNILKRFKSYDHFHLLTTTGWTDAQQTFVHQNRLFSCQWLGNVNMHYVGKMWSKYAM